MITLTYRSPAGWERVKSFQTLTGARRYARNCLGVAPLFAGPKAVGPDGQTIVVTGDVHSVFARTPTPVTVRMLFPDPAIDARFAAMRVANRGRA